MYTTTLGSGGYNLFLLSVMWCYTSFCIIICFRVRLELAMGQRKVARCLERCAVTVSLSAVRLKTPLSVGFSDKYVVSPLSVLGHCFDVVSLENTLTLTCFTWLICQMGGGGGIDCIFLSECVVIPHAYHSVLVDIVCFWSLLFAIVAVCRAVSNPV